MACSVHDYHVPYLHFWSIYELCTIDDISVKRVCIYYYHTLFVDFTKFHESYEKKVVVIGREIFFYIYYKKWIAKIILQLHYYLSWIEYWLGNK